MNIEKQILCILFSFIYGIIFNYIYRLFYKYLYNVRTRYKITNNLLFNIDFILIYFTLIKEINKGIINYYFIIFIILGFIFSNKKIK